MNQQQHVPAPTARPTFRRMTEDDLDHMAALLGDPQVMRYYPRPKTGTKRWPGSAQCRVESCPTITALVPQVDRVFRVVGLDTVIPLHPGVAETLQSPPV